MRGLRASTQRSVALHAARERRRERVTTVPSSLILSIKATLASFSPSVRRRALAVVLTFAVGFPSFHSLQIRKPKVPVNGITRTRVRCRDAI